MKFDIWASPEGETPDPDGGFEEHVDRYTTREGALAKARALLNEGRAVGIVPVADDADPPGGGGEELSDPLDIPPLLQRCTEGARP